MKRPASWIHYTTAWGAFYLDDLDESRFHFQAALRIFQKLEDVWGTAVCLVGFGNIARVQEDFVRATTLLGAAISLFRQSPRQPTAEEDQWLRPFVNSLQTQLDPDTYQTAYEHGVATVAEQIEQVSNTDS